MDDFKNYVEYEKSKKNQMKKNEMEVGFFDKIKNSTMNFFKSNNAPRLTTLMFYLLLIIGEYKVMESAMIMTKGNWELSLSVLLTTGVSAAVAERAHQNPKATKDQQFIASLMWTINIITAGAFGFMSFILAGKDLKYDINLLPGISFNIDGAGTILFGLVSLLTILEIVLYRSYSDKDIDTASNRRIAKLHEDERKADIDLAEAKIEQNTRMKIEHERKLALVEEKLNTIQILNERYAGKVPDEILQEVMEEITGKKAVNKNVQSPPPPNTSTIIIPEQASNTTIQKRKYTKRIIPQEKSEPITPNFQEEEKKEMTNTNPTMGTAEENEW